MGLGHPALLPGGCTRLGLFSGSLLSPTPRPGLARLPATLFSLPLARLSRGRDSTRGARGLPTHQLRSAHQTLGKEAHLGPRRPFWGTRGHLPAPAGPSPFSMATAQTTSETSEPQC